MARTCELNPGEFEGSSNEGWAALMAVEDDDAEP